MGFETQEAAERWAENAEFAADQRREERLINGGQPTIYNYDRIAIDACHKRIAELEAALQICRAYFAKVGFDAETIALIDKVLG